MAEASAPPPLGAYVKRVLVALVLIALALLLWRLRNVLLLAFGGVLLAILLRALSRPIARHTPLPDGWALAVTVALLAVALTGASVLLGAQIASQFDQLSQRLPSALEQVRQAVSGSAVGSFFLEELRNLRSDGGGVLDLSRITGLASATLGFLTDLVLILFLGLYFATNPTLYERGLVKLAPPARRRQVAEALNSTGRALQRWLLGQLVSMTVVGALTWLGLSLLGIPLALALALLAFVLEFVPIVGPIIAAVPGVLVAFSQSPADALYVGILYLLIQQAEGYVIMPLVQHWAVRLPPALALVSVLAFWLLFGWFGVLLATPLMVALMALIRKVYVEDILKAPTITDRATLRATRRH